MSHEEFKAERRQIGTSIEHLADLLQMKAHNVPRCCTATKAILCCYS
jgi:hypothetical protein